jgi:glucosamine kinase
MKKPLLIGDSGGTATDWCYVDAAGQRQYFTTESYQPVHFSEEFTARLQAFWQSRKIDAATEVHFFGAGFSLPHNQDWVMDHLHACGFSSVTIHSDLLGACLALKGDTAGTVAILGTGSVLAQYDGTQIVATRGGLGYLLGDEGAGYAFGRLFLNAYLHGNLSREFTDWVSQEIGDKPAVMREVYGPAGKKWIGQLGVRLAAAPFPQELEEIHRKNIVAFLETHLPTDVVPTIAFAGSYAFEKQTILREELQQKGWILEFCVAKPITRITDHYAKTTVQ